MPRLYGGANSLTEELLIDELLPPDVTGSELEPDSIAGKLGPLDRLNGAQAMKAMNSTLPPEASAEPAHDRVTKLYVTGVSKSIEAYMSPFPWASGTAAIGLCAAAEYQYDDRQAFASPLIPQGLSLSPCLSRG